jgi:hypothetical protein
MSVINPNGHRIYKPFPFRGPPKFTQIGIFGLKIYHLASLDYASNITFLLLFSVGLPVIFQGAALYFDSNSTLT